MAHLRERSLLPLLEKRLKLWPVLAVIGPRQIGKSTLLRDFLCPIVGATYVTFDRKALRDRAQHAPEAFLKTSPDTDDQPLIIDEAQKAPNIFDAIKADVDESKRRGRYILSGSTEFSQKTGIRESLTGRIGVTHLYPLTLAEIYQRDTDFPWVNSQPNAKVTLREIEIWLERGGIPGACFLRDQDERHTYFESWLETTCYRDLQQVQGGRLQGELARDILDLLPRLDHPMISECAAKLRVDARRIRVHIEALEALCLLHRLDPHPLGIGKPEYYLFDAGLAAHLGASRHMRLKIWALTECLAQYEYAGKPRPKLYTYRASKGSHIDMVIDDRKTTRAILLSHDESPEAYATRTISAFQKKLPSAQGLILAPSRNSYRETKFLTVLPWTAMG